MLDAGDGTKEGCRRLQCSDGACFPGVECKDSRNGPKCGSCPPGYIGMDIYNNHYLYHIQDGPSTVSGYAF